MSKRLGRRIEQLMLELVEIRSDTGTRLEKDVEQYIHNWLGSRDYFRNHTDFYGMYPLAEDTHDRAVIWALVKGAGRQTVIVMHHHDVVDAFDYGALSEVAFQPAELAEALSGADISEDVRQDLDSGEWIFGRGTADMKGGAAIQLTLLENFTRRDDIKGNLLMLSVPDEESLSVGMRGCLALIMELKERFGLEYKMLINSEPQFRDSDDGGVFYLGSAGKLLPVIYVRGKRTHVGQIFQGLNPVRLLAEIVCHTEINTDFSDRVGHETAPPPAWIHFRDRKECYDVSIPESAGGYLNLIHLTTSPGQMIERLKQTCEQAFESVIRDMVAGYSRYSRHCDPRPAAAAWQVNVKTFAELQQAAEADSGRDFLQAYSEMLKAVKSDLRHRRIDMAEATFSIVENTLGYVSDRRPLVVIALSPPYYPPIANIDFNHLPQRVAGLTSHLIQVARDKWDEGYTTLNYMMGITDMSYAALQNAERVVPHIGPNMPLWEDVYRIPFAEMAQLALPVINIGPWGKDCHKFTERVYRRDLLERTPALIAAAVDHLLQYPGDCR